MRAPQHVRVHNCQMFTLPNESTRSHCYFEFIARVECVVAVWQTRVLQNACIFKESAHFVVRTQGNVQRIDFHDTTNAMQQTPIPIGHNFFAHFLFNDIKRWPEIIHQIRYNAIICFSGWKWSFQRTLNNILISFDVSIAWIWLLLILLFSYWGNLCLLVVTRAQSLFIVAFELHDFSPPIWVLPLK